MNKARWLIIGSMLILSAGWIVFFHPRLIVDRGDVDSGPLLFVPYAIGWAAIFGSLASVFGVSLWLVRKSKVVALSAALALAALVEMLIFIRITCLPMHTEEFGHWQTMQLAFNGILPVVIGLGILSCLFLPANR